MSNFPISASATSQAVVMERLYVNFHKIVPDLALARGQFEFFTRLDQAMVGTVAQLRGWLLDGHKQDREEFDVIEFPASPWQFFKQRYAPEWWLRRWPVAMEERRVCVAVHHHHICPHVTVESSDLDGRSLHFMWMGEMSGQLPDGSCAEYAKRKHEQEMY